MRDAGGHSGNSFAETHIPLLMIGCNCESNNDKYYNQIDFASTFSILNGLPIPEASIGSIIPEMFFNMTELEKLNNLKMVNQRLLNMVEADGTEELKFQFEKAKSFHQMFEKDSVNKNAYRQAESNYLSSSQGLSDRLAQRSLNVNIFIMLLGLSFNILISVTIILPSGEMTKDFRLKWISFVPFIAGGFVLKLLFLNEVFEQKNDVESFVVMGLMSIILRMVLGVFDSKFQRFQWFRLFDHDLLYLLMLGHFFYIISVGSSSFVEEEHQIWYYLCNTMFAVFTFFEFRGRSNVKDFIAVTLKCFSFLFLHVVIRRMNQTGDKWINVPDLGDWLHRDVNQHYLHAFVVISLIASAAWLLTFHCSKPLLVPFILLGNVLLYFHHTRTINNRNDLPVTTLFWINLFVLLSIDVITNIKTQTKKSHLFVVFFFVSLLLHQPQNVIMTFACAVTCWFLNQTCNRIMKNTTERTVAKIFLHYWTGKLFYFYQGNSNSLTTIDVNAGFVGQMHVHLPIVFLFSTINTFNGQLMSLYLLVIHLIQDSKRLLIDDSSFFVQLLLKWLAILTVIPTTVFLVVITLLRHHLFIWSVFSPKLLYDFFVNSLMLFFMFIVFFTTKF